MIYVDTSVLVAALTRESETSRVQAWLQAQIPSELAISDWVTTEISSALALKVRTGQLDSHQRALVLSKYRSLAQETFQTFVVTPGHFRLAAAFTDQFALGLRSGDALHLAVASDFGMKVCTLDHRLAQAGVRLGICMVDP